jgi:chromosome segregation protein
MVLKKIEMDGFKSFADKIDISFGAGITAIVGPNGCGKSNISDAVKWVLGEQSHKAVRGSSMQDVIFKGTENRKMQSYCEVGLVFDNRGRVFPADEDEITFSRKLFRDGESEYAINGQPSRLKDITNLLHDSGIDRDGLTIISQGQVENLVSAKPEARRDIFEEAAGISKFRTRKDEAVRKLERTDCELVRVGDVIKEIERNLEPLLRAAEKAQKYTALRDELKKLEINLFVYKYDTAEEEKKNLQADADALGRELRQYQGELELIDRASNSGMGRLAELDSEIAGLRDRILFLSVDTERQSGEQQLYDATMDIVRQAELRKAELLSKRQMIQNIIESGEGFKYSVKKLLEEKKNNPEAAKAIVGVVSQELTAPPHLETAVEAALGAAAQNIITHDEEDAKRLVRILSQKNWGRATFLPITSVKPRELNQSERLALKEMGGAVIGIADELVKYRPEIAGVVSNLLGRVIICDNLDSAVALSKRAGYAFKAVTLDGDIIETRGSITGGSKSSVQNIAWHTNSLNQIEKELQEAEQKIKAAKASAEAIPHSSAVSKHRQELTALKQELAALTAERDSLHYTTGNSISGRGEITGKINELQVKYYYAANLLTKVDAEIENLSARIAEEYGLNYSACYVLKDESFDIQAAAVRAEQLKREIAHLGNVNLDAIEQVKTDRERYDSYKTQSDDLLAAKADLEKVIAELSSKMENDFKTAFDKINKNFGVVFRELFGGGNAKLVLTDEANYPDCGIDIIAEPPGKRLSSISLLSGGEKALTAIAILFAILKLRAMPFCLLDEIEAALDDANAVRFARYLRNFSHETQFIVITHRKPTMELADTLYGITMEQKGISKIVSVKLT